MNPQIVVARKDIFTILAILSYPAGVIVEAGTIWCTLRLSTEQLDTLKRNEIKYSEANYEKAN